ncbi:MAG TPA: hypothetical protein VFN13_03895 [Rudaea sp.]|nr:hypothetical protein [Rudaea sp.]
MNQPTFRQLNRLETVIDDLVCDIRFIANLVGLESRSLKIDSEAMMVVLTQIARQLEAAQRIARRMVRIHARKSIGTKRAATAQTVWVAK